MRIDLEVLRSMRVASVCLSLHGRSSTRSIANGWVVAKQTSAKSVFLVHIVGASKHDGHARLPFVLASWVVRTKISHSTASSGAFVPAV